MKNGKRDLKILKTMKSINHSKNMLLSILNSLLKLIKKSADIF